MFVKIIILCYRDYVLLVLLLVSFEFNFLCINFFLFFND